MQIEIKVTESATFAARMAEIRSLSSSILLGAGRDVVQYLREYHRGFNWKGPRYMPGRFSSQFAQNVVAGWQQPQISGKQVVIKNTFGLLHWKTTGGTIYPVAARMLTIPLISQAKGISAAEFAAEAGTPLFRAGNALCRRIGKQLEAIYALKESVTQQPTEGAMPDDATLKAVFAESAKKQIQAIARQ